MQPAGIPTNDFIAETEAESDARRVRTLKLLLRTFGAICLTALLPLLMPAAWIHATHEWLGWGPFPTAPVALYMARSNSALSAFYGGLLLVLSLDVSRLRPRNPLSGRRDHGLLDRRPHPRPRRQHALVVCSWRFHRLLGILHPHLDARN